jgi:hypothetical protein
VTLFEYVRHLADLMDLRDWHIVTTVGKVADDELATCEPVYGQKRASITLTDKWAELSSEDLRSTVVHELIHCHLSFVDHLASTVGEAALSKQANKVWEAAYSLEVEHATDALSLVLAKYLPVWERPCES